MSTSRFRIAFSFAGEKREFVAEVAGILAKGFGKDRILYDSYHEAEFAAVDLAFILPRLYKSETDLVVTVFCPSYESQRWCGLEWPVIYSFIKDGGERLKRVMLSRFDRVDIKGLRGLSGFIELDDKTPKQFAALILERLALNEGKDKEHYTREFIRHLSPVPPVPMPQQFAKRILEQLARNEGQEKGRNTPEFELQLRLPPLPPVPEALTQAMASGDCVLHAGAGLSVAAGLPTYREFMGRMLDEAVHHNWISHTDGTAYAEALQGKDTGPAIDRIISDLEPYSRALRDHLANFFRSPQPVLTPLHESLFRLPFCAALSACFDRLLEEAYATLEAQTPFDLEDLTEKLRQKKFLILKLQGDTLRKDSVLLSPSQLEDAVRDSPFSTWLDNLFFSKTFVFVGHSPESLEQHLRALQVKKRPEGRPHYLLGRPSQDGWEAQARWLEKRYGIITLDANPASLPAFLSTLEKDIQVRRRHSRAQQQGVGLKRVVLENIGPFESLELALDPEWNILLGDNGVGKSFVLKAVALAICGQDAQGHAHHLVKTGATRAAVTIETDHATYRTEIALGSSPSNTRVTSIPFRPLEVETWLALGFPPLRTAGWDRRKWELSTVDIPTSEDLLPLLAGGVDPRLDKLKQWLIQLDHRSKDEQLQRSKEDTPHSGEGPITRLLDEVFIMISQLVEGVTIRRGEVNPQTSEITVHTDDGPLPVEALSQGTLSLIGWVGVVLQRLHEVYCGDPNLNPRECYALVLMDEIDAHLHPAWQQSLVTKLRTIFPKVQFIASTHSPLIVGGMATDHIIRLSRDADGRVQRVPIDADMTMGRTDQILTTDLFSLRTTLDQHTQDLMAEYQTLLGKKKRTSEEDARFQQVRTLLHSRVPPVAESLEERRATAGKLTQLVSAMNEQQPGEAMQLALQHQSLTKEIASIEKNILLIQDELRLKARPSIHPLLHKSLAVWEREKKKACQSLQTCEAKLNALRAKSRP
ncbi:MAG: hypothetical protein B7Z37_00960 [Verrucomicrobia bacterium 12-59-8]|nr:MAG: hypothetical protein B7Z37_00960 [Verrucomicrobia bacterium 12-59-8]